MSLKCQSHQKSQLPLRKLSGMCKCHYQYVDPWVFVLEIIAQVDG